MSIKHLFNSYNKFSREQQLTQQELFSSAVSLILVEKDFINGVPAYIEARKLSEYAFLLENNPIHILISGVINSYCDNIEKAHEYFYLVLENYKVDNESSNEIIFLNAYIHFELAKAFIFNTSSIDKSNHLKNAIELFTRLSDQKGLGECYSLKADFFFQQRNFISAIENYLQSILCFQSVGQPNLIVKYYLKIAEANVEISNYKEWEWYLNLASDKLYTSDSIHMNAEIAFTRAKGLYKQNKIEDAINCLCGVERFIFSKENISCYIKQFALLEDCYSRLNQATEVLQYYKMGIELKSNLAQIEKDSYQEKNCCINIYEKYELELLIQEKSNFEINELKSKLTISKGENDRLVELLSHDFKEPVRVISSFASLLAKNTEQKQSEKDREYIQFILNSATKMSSHIDNLLKYIQMDTETCEISELNLNDLIDEVKNDLSFDIAHKKALVVASNLPKIKACKEVFNVLFYNLVENAIKFNYNTPMIRIDYSKKNNQHEFSVSDNGIGIADEDKEKVFDLFRKINKTNEFEGWGVGLSVSKKIVNSLGGQIQIEDNPNGGTKVKFVLDDSYILN